MFFNWLNLDTFSIIITSNFFLDLISSITSVSNISDVFFIDLKYSYTLIINHDLVFNNNFLNWQLNKPIFTIYNGIMFYFLFLSFFYYYHFNKYIVLNKAFITKKNASFLSEVIKILFFIIFFIFFFYILDNKVLHLTCLPCLPYSPHFFYYWLFAQFLVFLFFFFYMFVNVYFLNLTTLKKNSLLYMLYIVIVFISLFYLWNINSIHWFVFFFNGNSYYFPTTLIISLLLVTSLSMYGFFLSTKNMFRYDAFICYFSVWLLFYLDVYLYCLSWYSIKTSGFIVFYFLDINNLLDDVSDFCNTFFTHSFKNNNFNHYDFLDVVHNVPSSSSSKTFFSKEKVGLDVFFTKGKKIKDFITNTPTVTTVTTVPTPTPTIPTVFSNILTTSTTNNNNNTPVVISPLLDNNLGVLVPTPTYKYLLLKNVKTLLCGMKLDKNVSYLINPSSLFYDEVNKIISDLYKLVLNKYNFVTEKNIRDTFIYVFSFKKDIWLSKTYLENVLTKTEFHSFFKEITIKNNSINSNSLGEKLKGISIISSSSINKLFNAREEGNVLSIITFQEIAKQTNSLVLIPTHKVETRVFLVPIDAVFINKKSISFLLDDNYYYEMINLLDENNRSVENIFIFKKKIHENLLIVENKVNTSRKSYTINEIDLLMYEYTYPQSKILLTDNNALSIKNKVDGVNSFTIYEKNEFVHEAATNPSTVSMQQAKKLFSTGKLFSHLNHLNLNNLFDKNDINSSLEEISKSTGFKRHILETHTDSIEYVKNTKKNNILGPHEYNKHIDRILNINYNEKSIDKCNRIKSFDHENSMMYHKVKDNIDISKYKDITEKSIDKKSLSLIINKDFLSNNTDVILNDAQLQLIEERVICLVKKYTELYILNSK